MGDNSIDRSRKRASIGGELIFEKEYGRPKLNNLIFVEGQDEVNFFHILLNTMGITDVDLREVGGKGQFRNYFPSFIDTQVDMEQIQSIVTLCDADDNANTTFQSIISILSNRPSLNGVELPNQMGIFSEGVPKIGVFIMPNNSDSGELEDLCLQIINEHPAMGCVNPFITCASELDKPPQKISKAKIQSFLAIMPEIVTSLGIGAHKGYWNFESEELDDLKSFLENLR